MVKDYAAVNAKDDSHGEPHADKADSGTRLRSSVSNQEQLEHQRSARTALGTEGDTTGPRGPKQKDPEEVARQIVVPSIDTVAEFRQRAQRIFTGMDADGNGFLSRGELALAVEKHSYTGEDAQVVAGLFYGDAFKGLVNFSDDQPGKETELSGRDIEKMDIVKRLEPVMNADLTTEWANENFARVDADSNGYISFPEIGALLKDSTISGRDRKALTEMQTAFDAMKRSSDDEFFFESEISRNDLTEYTKSFANMRSEANTLFDALSLAQRTHSSDVNGSDSLYGSANARKAISPDAIMQGGVGDCYFLAALASVAKDSPQSIEKMIKDNKNGTYTVTFPGDPTHPVTVSGPTDAERGLYNAGTEFGIWPNVMERAFGQWRLDRRNSLEPTALTVVEATNGPDTGEFAMKLLTGHAVSLYKTEKASDEDLASDLDFALNRGRNSRAVTAVVPEKPGEERTADGFPRQHLYSVLKFERTGKEDGLVTLRNPWGIGNDSPNGTVTIDLDVFRRNFAFYNVATGG